MSINTSLLPPGVLSIAGAAMSAERRALYYAERQCPANQEIAEADAARLWRVALAYLGDDGAQWDRRPVL